jgi:hypothetical protein
LSFAFVFHVSDVTIFVGAVGNDLSAAIGEKNAVGSDHNFTVALGFMGVVVLGWLILDGPGEFVGHRGLLFFR